jgi:hypothetical protein
MDNKLALQEMAIQMFRDLYLTIIKGNYGKCYYIRSLGGKGAFLRIDITEKVLKTIPLPLLSVNNVIREYKRIAKAKKKSFSYDWRKEA